MAGFISRKKEFQAAAEEQIVKALEMCGIVAEGYAKDKCPVDSGLLRNSITYARSGESTAISSYSSNDGEKVGTYSGIAEQTTSPAVFIGTNVEYAPYVELGTGSFYQGGTPSIPGQKAQPYLKPAVADHADEYKRIIKDVLKG